MKRGIKTTGYIIAVLAAVAVGLVVTKAVSTSAAADETIKAADAFIEAHARTRAAAAEPEPETVSLSYEEWLISKNEDLTAKSEQNEQIPELNEPIPEQKDIWQLGTDLYGISELDTTRTLKIISREGYGYSPLSYYVACCCWVRATEGYWGYGNLYRAFGEADESYDLWMDNIEIADWAYEYLRTCYESPSYVRYCNGMMAPETWVYEEDGIYVW